jgi:hypothetical protein
MGPWLRPPVDTLDGSAIATVMKTAAFTDNRRIGVAFLSSRRDNKDSGRRLYGGNAVFREIFQHEDGTLGTKFPREMVPEFGKNLDLPYAPLTKAVSRNGATVCIEALAGLGASMLENVPRNVRITLNVKPEANSADFGLWLRASGNLEKGYQLHFLPYERKVTLNEQSITVVDALDQPFSLEIILKDDIVDVCVDQRWCLVDRCPELLGDRVFFFCQNGEVAFESIAIAALIS